MEVTGHKVAVLNEKDSSAIGWGKAGADYVRESMGSLPSTCLPPLAQLRP